MQAKYGLYSMKYSKKQWISPPNPSARNPRGKRNRSIKAPPFVPVSVTWTLSSQPNSVIANENSRSTMFGRSVLLPTFSALIISMTINSTNAQCTNGACDVANTIFTKCRYGFTTLGNFKLCLCTNKFLVNYDRCARGYVCAWDGNPDTLNGVCIALYCPGPFAGGFDAKAFCAGTSTTPAASSTASARPSKTFSESIIFTAGPVEP